jgi:hypothetical protein
MIHASQLGVSYAVLLSQNGGVAFEEYCITAVAIAELRALRSRFTARLFDARICGYECAFRAVCASDTFNAVYRYRGGSARHRSGPHAPAEGGRYEGSRFPRVPALKVVRKRSILGVEVAGFVFPVATVNSESRGTHAV